MGQIIEINRFKGTTLWNALQLGRFEPQIAISWHSSARIDCWTCRGAKVKPSIASIVQCETMRNMCGAFPTIWLSHLPAYAIGFRSADTTEASEGMCGLAAKACSTSQVGKKEIAIQIHGQRAKTPGPIQAWHQSKHWRNRSKIAWTDWEWLPWCLLKAQQSASL